jgi:sporulation protein YlmC with PRC-barrel domain
MFNRTWSGYAGSSDWKRREEVVAVASEGWLRELEEKYEGYKVYDNRGERIGKVDDLFVDETDREEYIGVKMGFFGRKSTLIPMEIIRVNEADRAIEVSESKDHVKSAPSFDDEEDITYDYEERIRSHFGLQSQRPSQTRGSYGAYSGDEESHRGQVEDQTADAESRNITGEEGVTTERPSTHQSGETPSSPRTEEGGRTKVRRRIIREEIIEEEPNDHS